MAGALLGGLGVSLSCGGGGGGGSNNNAEAPVSGTCTTPAGVSTDAAAAHQLVNSVRRAMGIDCATMVPEINLAAQRHSEYYAAHKGTSCTVSPHNEVSTCSLFTGTNFWDRMNAAGYSGSPAFECMHFLGNGAQAVQGWIDSVWHRTPILSPWVRDLGYGKATGCDTMDFGVGISTPSTVIAMYPYDGQVGVPRSFDGRTEGPTPSEPPTGWPSGYPIHFYIRSATVTNHTLAVEPVGTALAHVWLAPGTPEAMGLLSDEFVMYSHSPLAAQTTYRVTVQGTHSGSPFTRSWTFSTGN